MPRLTRRAALVGASALALTIPVASPAAAARRTVAPPVLDFELTNVDFQIPGPATRPPGLTTFRAHTADTSGHFLMMFQPRPGIPLATAVQEIIDSANPDPAIRLPAIRDLFRDVEFHGGLKVVAGITVAFTVLLKPGTYYLAETPIGWVPGRAPDGLRSFEVAGAPTGARMPRVDAAVAMADTPAGRRFLAPRTLPAAGNVLVANRAHQPHELIIEHVVPGTTDADLRAYFTAPPDAPLPSPLLATVSGLLNLSPGNWAILHLDVPPGEYALLSFITSPDTGESSTALGMARTVRLTG